MKLSSFVVCQDIRVDPNNNEVALIQPLQAIPLVSLPSTYSFSISLGLVDIDKKGKDAFSVVINDPEDKELQKLEMELPLPPEEIAGSEKMYGAMMNLDFKNMIFEKKGFYKIVFSGSIKDEFSIWVNKNE